MAYAVGGVLLTFGLALGYTLLTEKLPERRCVLIQGMFRSNYVIMGIPVATALLGADQLGTVSILIAVIVPLFNMLAVVVLEVFRGQKPKPLHILGQIAKNPLVSFEMDRGHALILDDEHGNCTMTYESVIGQGRISVVPDADKERALRVLMAQYRAPDFPYSKAVIPATTVLCLTVEHMTGKRRVKKHG